MKRSYTKFQEAVKMLHEGWEIYTDRGGGGAPYNPLFFRLYKGNREPKEVHHTTVKKLISKKIINGTNVEYGKYKLIIKRESKRPG